MTLCIAAISEKGTAVIGLSDRMLTVGGMLEYEPREQKIITITDSIFIMLADDMSLQAEVILEIQQVISNEPEKKWSVAEIASLYHRLAASIPADKNLSNVLAPFGLDKNSFIDKQNQMKENFIEKITDEILDCKTPLVEAIIAGVDTTGAHVFKKNGYKLDCEDYAGYATIGNGGWLAEAEMTRTAYAKFVGVAQSAFICYMAKKTAESASGVGKHTDIIFAVENHIAFFPDALLLELHNHYMKMKSAELKNQVKHFTNWTEFVKKHEIEVKVKDENGESDKADN